MSSEYYPAPSPNGICAEKVMKCCRKRGYEVVYLGATFYRQLPRYENIDGIDVYRVDHSLCDRLFHAWHELPLWLGLPLRFLLGIYSTIRNLLFLVLWPFEDFGLYFRFCKKITELHRKYKFDAVFVMCNPIEGMAAVCRFKKKNRDVPCICDYLDALSCGSRVQKIGEKLKCFPFKKFFSESAKRLEVLFGKNADRVIVTEATREHYEKEFSGSELFQKIEFLGIPVLEEKDVGLSDSPEGHLSDSIFRPDRKHVLFAGSLNALRDPSYLIEVIKNLKRDDVEFVFIGSYALRNSNLLDIAGKDSPDLFKMHPRMPRAALEKYMVHADFFLNIEDNVPTLFASKVFEYISYGKPIISNAYSENDPTVKILKKYDNSLVLLNTDSVLESAKRLNRFIDTHLGRNIEFERCKELFYSSTPDAFVDVLDEVLNA